MQRYQKINLIGEGAYGVVWKCRHMDTKELVAIKKFKESEDDENVKKTTIRQIKILRMLEHTNIVRLKQALRKKGIVFLIFEYLPYNLLEIIEQNPEGIQPETTKQIIYQTLKGLAHMHSLNIIHRDIKPQNILVSDNSKINAKICDFGFAKELKSRDQMTDYVATRWYRAPELLVGADYEKPVDIWAVGCLFGELIDGVPLYPGSDDFDQLYLIQKSQGYVDQDHYQYFIKNQKYIGKKLPEINTLDSLDKRYYGKINSKGLDLLKRLLKMSPQERITASQALKHPYFDSIRQEACKKSVNETRVISACETNFTESKKREFTGYVHDQDRQATISSIYASKNSKSQIRKKQDGSPYNSSYLKAGLRDANSKSMSKNTKRSRQNPGNQSQHHNRGSSKTQMDFYPEMTEPKQTVLELPSKMSINKIYGSNHPKQSVRFKSVSKKGVQSNQQIQEYDDHNNVYSTQNNQTPIILFGNSQRRKSKSRERERPNINIVINHNTWLPSGAIVINK